MRCDHGAAGAMAADGRPDAEADRVPALRDFLVTHYAHLHRRLQRHLGCPDLASDSLHDAWVRLGRATVLSAVHSPEAYIYRMACNAAMDQLRSHRAWQYAADADAALECVADEAPGPEVIAEARSDLAAVQAAMSRLPRRHCSILVELRIEERSRQEVAQWHRISLRSVETVLRQALDYCALPARGADRVSTALRSAPAARRLQACA
ncbi:MAG: sigma-70 family RNA polymerase sigma factor [Rhodocyclaceae bacterium]